MLALEGLEPTDGPGGGPPGAQGGLGRDRGEVLQEAQGYTFPDPL